MVRWEGDWRVTGTKPKSLTEGSAILFYHINLNLKMIVSQIGSGSYISKPNIILNEKLHNFFYTDICSPLLLILFIALP